MEQTFNQVKESLKEEIKYFCDLHDNQGQRYGNKKDYPYSYHLDMVCQQALLYSKYLHPSEYRNVILGCYGHDSIEDARLTYNDIKERFKSVDLAEIIFLCTEYRGRNREERKPAEFYIELRQNYLATFVKICDLLANVKYSYISSSSMFKKYNSEYREKIQPLLQETSDTLPDMFRELNILFSTLTLQYDSN